MTHWFNGGRSDLDARLYDRALSDAEVAKLYKSAGGKASQLSSIESSALFANCLK